MRRRRNRYSKGDILIDLTSLLDVIFIILLIVISRQQNLTSEVQAQQAEALELSEQARVQLQLYTDQMDSVDSLCLVSIHARYETDNIKTRHISILKKGKTEEKIDMIGDNTKEALEELKESLKEYIDSNSGKPVILSLNENDEDILYRDEKAIKNIFEELINDYKDVYIKGVW